MGRGDRIFGFPLRFPLWIVSLNKAIHPGSTFFFHLFRNMTVYTKGKCYGSMTQIFLNHFDIVHGLNGNNSVHYYILILKCRKADKTERKFDGIYQMKSKK